MSVVVGAAIVATRDGVPQLLAAERAAPPELAGWWELPGGKVDAGESDEQALIRECREELGVTVTLHDRVGPDLPIGTAGVLRVWSATVPDALEPQCLEHRSLRWLGPGEVHTVRWLPADLPLVPDLENLLRRTMDSP